jgi:hypothetical protein
MTFDQILALIDPKEPTFQTLGKRSNFQARVVGGHIVITSSTGKKYPPVDAAFYNLVLQWYMNLEVNLSRRTDHYTDSYWPQCPCRNRSPWVAALIIHFVEKQNQRD